MINIFLHIKKLFIFTLFFHLITLLYSQKVYTYNNLSPSSLFTNKFHIVEGEDIDKNITEGFKQLIFQSKGIVDAIPFNYSLDSENLYPDNSIFQTDENKILTLLKKHILSSKACPIFFVTDKDNNIEKLKIWLSLSFPKRDFIIIPCWNEFSRTPKTEEEYNRSMHWNNLYYTLVRGGVEKINYIGDESVEKLFKGITHDRDPVNYGEKVSTLDLIAMHSTLNLEQEDHLIEQERHKSISKRNDLSYELMEKILLSNKYEAITLLILNNPSKINDILSIFNNNMNKISNNTINYILTKLPQNHSSINYLFNFYCSNGKSIFLNEKNTGQKFEPDSILNRWDLEYQIDAINYLYGKGFKDWKNIFSDYKSLKTLIAIFEGIPEIGASIILSMAKEDFLHSIKLIELINGENKEAIDLVLTAALEVEKKLKILTPILTNNTIPHLNRIYIALNFFIGSTYLNSNDYGEKLLDIFTNRNFLAFLIDSNNIPILKNWLKIITLFPDTFKIFENLIEFIPSAYKNSPHKYSIAPLNEEYLNSLILFLEKFIYCDYKNILSDKIGDINKIIYNFQHFMTMALLISSNEKNNFIELMEKNITTLSSNQDLIEILSRKEKPNINNFIELILILNEQNYLINPILKLLDIPEFSTYRINLIRLSTILLHENFQTYASDFEKIISNCLTFSNTRKSKQQIIKLIITFSNLIKIPKNDKLQTELTNIVYESITNYENLSDEIKNKTSFPNEIDKSLKQFLISILKIQWDIVINKDIKQELLFERLNKISSFFIYLANWMTISKDSSDYEGFMKNISILKNSVLDFLNNGNESIKNTKFGGTKESQKQLKLMRKLLLKKYKDEKIVELYMKNFESDYMYPVITSQGKVFFTSYTNSLEFWLNRGLYGGGNCAAPNREIVYTKAANGANYSALSTRIILSTTPYGKDAIISETRSISKENGIYTPVLLYEHMYKVFNLPLGTNSKDFADAAILTAMKNAARYGFDKIFFAKGTKEASGFSIYDMNIGDSTDIEYIKDGLLIKEKITVSKVIKESRNFIIPEEPVRWKYTDNVLYKINESGSYEKASENFNIVDFQESKTLDIEGLETRCIEVQIEGALMTIRREIISSQSVTLKNQLTEMLSNDELKANETIEAISKMIEEKTLHLVARKNFSLERTQNIHTTISLIDEITNMQIATDRYLKNIYAITERLGHYLLNEIQDFNNEKFAVKKSIIGIPRGGIPILSKLSRFFNNRNININSKIIDMQRSILDESDYKNIDTVIICDQVINTGKTIGVTIEYLLKNKNPKLKFYILSITADPNAILRLKRKYPQIEKIFVGDIRQRIEEKSGIKAVLGHPGERSLPGEAFDKLLTKDSIIQIGQRFYHVEKAIDFNKYFRAFKVKNTNSGKNFFLRIMVDEEEALVAESISALAREEQFLGGLPRDAFFDREKGMLLTEYFSDFNIEKALINIIKANQNIEPFLVEIWKDIKNVLIFLKENHKLIVDIKPETIVMDIKHANWTLTNFYSEANQGRPVTEANAVKQVGKIFEYAKKISESQNKPVKADLIDIIQKISTLEINNFEALDFAMQRMNFSLEDDDTYFDKSA